MGKLSVIEFITLKKYKKIIFYEKIFANLSWKVSKNLSIIIYVGVIFSSNFLILFYYSVWASEWSPHITKKGGPYGAFAGNIKE